MIFHIEKLIGKLSLRFLNRNNSPSNKQKQTNSGGDNIGGNKVINYIINQSEKPNKEEEEKIKEKEMQDFRKGIQTYITGNTEVGSISDYKEWLDGFKQKGGTVLDYKLPNNLNNFRLVEKEISIPPLYGTLAYNFIVKNNGKVILKEGNPGHCGIYYFNNFNYEGAPPGNI